MKPTRADLVEALEAATGAAVKRLFREHAGEHFYYVALVTTGEALAPVLSAWSTEALDQAAAEAQGPDARAELEWSYADSPYHAYGEDLFGEVRRLFIAFARDCELRIAAMVEAIERLDRNGAFGTGADRARLLVNVEVMPPDHTNAERARRLNPPGVFERWARVAAEPEPEPPPARRLVRVRWRGGRPSNADVMWARSVSPLVAEAPLHVASQHLRRWEDFVLGWYPAGQALSIGQAAEQRGHQVELLSAGEYAPAYIERALECPALREGELRVIFVPSMSLEGVITARRTSFEWVFEARIPREFLARRFDEVRWEDWPAVERRPGFDLFRGTISLEEAAHLESSLIEGRPTPVRWGADGITVHVSSRLEAAEFEESAWSPEPGTRARAAVDLTLALLGTHAAQWRAVTARYFG